MIRIDNVSKRFGGGLLGCSGFLALEDISLTIASGSVYGLVGYNGAGKTTLLKCIAGIYRPSKGRIYIDDRPALRRAPGSLYIVADEPYFIPQATPDIMGRYTAGYYPAWDEKLYRDLLALFDLKIKSKIEGFSKGMQRQTGIALGLASGARSLLLDESFDGLDLSKRRLIKELLKGYAASRQAAVAITSHNLSEIEDAVDSLGMIDGRHLVFSGSVEEVHSQHPGKTLEEIFLGAKDFGEVDIAALFAKASV